MTDLTGRAVLVSGGGSGIGAATARLLRDRGARVAVMGRRGEELAVIAEAIGALAVEGDAAEPADADRAVASVLEAYGRLDAVVAGAGGLVPGSAAELDDAGWAEAFRANVTTGFVLVRAALPALLEARGSIVLISSGGGTAAVPGLAGYISAKHAVIGLGRSLAVDYGPAGLRVNVITPGIVRTAMSSGLAAGFLATGSDDEDAWRRVGAHLPTRRVSEPDEVARVCAFLISEEASGITGAVIPVDSGASAVDPTGFVGAFAEERPLP